MKKTEKRNYLKWLWNKIKENYDELMILFWILWFIASITVLTVYAIDYCK